MEHNLHLRAFIKHFQYKQQFKTLFSISIESHIKV